MGVDGGRESGRSYLNGLRKIDGWGLPEEVGALAAGTDETQFSSQHVDELWQIIDADVPEKPSHSGQLCVLTQGALRIVHRSAEFQRSDLTTPEPEALAARADRTRTVQFDCERDDRHQWQGKRDQGARKHKIASSLHTIDPRPDVV
jgi:hypothetical protein